MTITEADTDSSPVKLAQLPEQNGTTLTKHESPSVNSSVLKMAEYVKVIESRFEEIEKKYEELLGNKSKTDEEKESGEKKEDGNKDKNEKKDEEDDAIELTTELNRLSWVKWRKLKAAEEEFEKLKNDAPKKRVREKGKAERKKFVIDVVSDPGDLGFYSSTDKIGSIKRHWIPCRIRINSEHIMDALNEVTGIILPFPCQILHPFKIIVDHIDGVREYIRTLEDELVKAKAARDVAAKLQEKEKENGDEVSHDRDMKPTVKEKDSKASNDKPPRSKEEEEYDLAEEKCKHYRCFLELLDTNLAQELETARSIRNGTAQKIIFSHLWYLFPPGETIFYQDPNRDEPPQVTQVLKVSGGRARLPNAQQIPLWAWPDRTEFRSKYSPFTIDSFHLDFDGKKFRLVQDKYDIPRYNGDVPITSLRVFPLRFLPESTRAQTLQSLLTRGENFRSLATVDAAHREYHGMSLDAEKEEIDGRVIIDFKSSPIIPPPSAHDVGRQDNESENKIRIFGLRPLTQTSDDEVCEVVTRYGDPDISLYDDHEYDIEKTDKLFLVNRVLLAPSQEMSSNELTDDELRLLPGTAYAYVLRSRKYCKCDISLIREIHLNKAAFDDLVLPENHRRLIKSLVDRHSHGSSPVERKADKETPHIDTNDQLIHDEPAHQDTLSIVKGKGRGLIILLHGVPGVGKTSTAETIADATGRPLLPVTCGDIGENAGEVEKNLEQIFTNSHRWGCVLLLDEAEVFLVKRNNEDLKRNAMVSVFLRVLEYYSGILFLTTNRVGTIDEAFKSRIHISLYYPPLDWPTSKKIWRVNLRRSQNKVEADEESIIKFAKKHFHHNDNNTRWNGRQIYNAFKTAIALAQFEKPDRDMQTPEKPKLLASHFQQVARASRKFDDYLLLTQGGESISATNQLQNVRADNFGMENAPILKRRQTRTRNLDMDELPSTSEDNSDSDEVSASSDEAVSSEEEKISKKKKAKSSKGKQSNEKKKKKSKKSKKSTKDESESGSDSSS